MIRDSSDEEEDDDEQEEEEDRFGGSGLEEAQLFHDKSTWKIHQCLFITQWSS